MCINLDLRLACPLNTMNRLVIYYKLILCKFRVTEIYEFRLATQLDKDTNLSKAQFADILSVKI